MVHSGSPLGAVAKLLIHSPGRHVSASDLETDPMASGPGRVEMVVLPPTAPLTSGRASE